MNRKSIIISIKSFELSVAEEKLIKNNKPWGVILFKRNIANIDQLKKLTSRIRFLMKDKFYPIMIDEEGGKVSRLSNIFNTKNFSQNYFGKQFEKNLNQGIKLYEEYLSFISQFLSYSGINMNTIPVLDVLKKNTHSIIGNRAYSSRTNTINTLKKTCFKILSRYKIACVMKHIPGHGSSIVDTHKVVSVVNRPTKSLLNDDFKVFKNFNSKFAITAHIIYKSIDPFNTATHSKNLIKNIIRKKLMFKGILISDDISMKALSGDIIYNAQKAIESGCNLVLYCKGDIKESSALLAQIANIDNFTTKKTSEFYRFLR